MCLGLKHPCLALQCWGLWGILHTYPLQHPRWCIRRTTTFWGRWGSSQSWLQRLGLFNINVCFTCLETPNISWMHLGCKPRCATLRRVDCSSLHHPVQPGCSWTSIALIGKKTLKTAWTLLIVFLWCFSELRSSPSTGRSWLNPEGIPSKCVHLANVFVMRMPYMHLSEISCLSETHWGHTLNMQEPFFHVHSELTNNFIIVKYKYLIWNLFGSLREWNLSLYYAWQRGVYIAIEQPISSVTWMMKFKDLYLHAICFFLLRSSLTGSLLDNSWLPVGRGHKTHLMHYLSHLWPTSFPKVYISVPWLLSCDCLAGK